ncbi:hypothetical protein F3Y22_tig00116996pilonHSYRG00504 [Hibiscus syriacus]|uniref:Sugar phosphate transporter domain-containing protein n=1 Tax=Hibiscus syriacus TaxID=106335 RepID=A0A6A2WS42_HIBSY|nr:hypothetical protein F3Y22_tig00116996pilonHSYRG00504 [Hibiscus syriacus]
MSLDIGTDVVGESDRWRWNELRFRDLGKSQREFGKSQCDSQNRVANLETDLRYRRLRCDLVGHFVKSKKRNATVAYVVNLTNFLVTKHTSALTLQVLGNAKAALAAFVSVMIFRNPVTVMGMTGFAVTIMGVVLYSEAKKRSKAQLATN